MPPPAGDRARGAGAAVPRAAPTRGRGFGAGRVIRQRRTTTAQTSAPVRTVQVPGPTPVQVPGRGPDEASPLQIGEVRTASRLPNGHDPGPGPGQVPGLGCAGHVGSLYARAASALSRRCFVFSTPS